MAFTTWADYHKQILDILAQVESGFIALSSVSPVGPDGVARQFRSLDELRRYLDWVRNNTVAEAAATDGRGRRMFCGMVQ